MLKAASIHAGCVARWRSGLARLVRTERYHRPKRHAAIIDPPARATVRCHGSAARLFCRHSWLLPSHLRDRSRDHAPLAGEYGRLNAGGFSAVDLALRR